MIPSPTTTTMRCGSPILLVLTSSAVPPTVDEREALMNSFMNPCHGPYQRPSPDVGRLFIGYSARSAAGYNAVLVCSQPPVVLLGLAYPKLRDNNSILGMLIPYGDEHERNFLEDYVPGFGDDASIYIGLERLERFSWETRDENDGKNRNDRTGR